MMTDFQIQPAYFAPYIQTISWLRPGSASGFHAYASGSRQLDLFDYQTYHVENTEVFEHSLLNAVKDGDAYLPDLSTEMKANGEYEADWEDAPMTGNLIENFLGSTYTTL